MRSSVLFIKRIVAVPQYGLAMSEPDVAYAKLDSTAEIRQPIGRELGLTAFGMGLMILRPRQRLRVHTHDHQEEAFLVLAGELTLSIEGVEHLLGPRELARVGPGVRRQLINRGNEQLEVLAIGAAGSHESRDGRAWTSWDEPGDGRPPQDVALPDDLPA